MSLSRFVRAGLALSIIWIAGSLIFGRPDGLAASQAEQSAFDSCMFPLHTHEGYSEVEDGLAELVEAGASSNAVRKYLLSRGFENNHLNFDDTVFLEPREKGFSGTYPVLSAARILRVSDCQQIASRQRITSLTEAWWNTGLITLIGVALLWAGLLSGRATLRWIMQGK